MIARLLAWCTRRHWLVIATALVLGLSCELARRSLVRDALPDLSDPQIAVVVEWMGHPASEVAERVTTPTELEAALRRAISHRRPHLLELLTPYEECLPLMPPGQSFNEMIVDG